MEVAGTFCKQALYSSTTANYSHHPSCHVFSAPAPLADAVRPSEKDP